jgi:hypothetical protein
MQVAIIDCGHTGVPDCPTQSHRSIDPVYVVFTILILFFAARGVRELRRGSRNRAARERQVR